jgi:hypothetical protein
MRDKFGNTAPGASMKPEHLLWVALCLLALGLVLPLASVPTVGSFRLATHPGGIPYFVGLPLSLFASLNGKWRVPFWFGVFATVHGAWGFVRVMSIDDAGVGGAGLGPGFQCLVGGGVLLALVAHRQQRATPVPQP